MKKKSFILVCTSVCLANAFAANSSPLTITNLDAQNSVTLSISNNNSSISNIKLNPKERCYVNNLDYIPTNSGDQTTITLVSSDGSVATIKHDRAGTDGNVYNNFYPNDAATGNLGKTPRFYIQYQNPDSWTGVDDKWKATGIAFDAYYSVNDKKDVDYVVGIAPAGLQENAVKLLKPDDSTTGYVFSCEHKSGGFGMANN